MVDPDDIPALHSKGHLSANLAVDGLCIFSKLSLVHISEHQQLRAMFFSQFNYINAGGNFHRVNPIKSCLQPNGNQRVTVTVTVHNDILRSVLPGNVINPPVSFEEKILAHFRSDHGGVLVSHVLGDNQQI